MFQPTLENAGNRDDELLNQSIDEHRTNDLSDHRKGVDQHLGNSCQRTKSGKRNRRNDTQRVPHRSREHTQGVAQTEHDEAEKRRRCIKPIEPVHTRGSHKVHRRVILTSRL